MSDELRKLREQVAALGSEPETAELSDEAWYDRLWELLDPVIDARAYRSLADANPAGELPAWARNPLRPLGLDDEKQITSPGGGFEGATRLLVKHLADDHQISRDAERRWNDELTRREKS